MRKTKKGRNSDVDQWRSKFIVLWHTAVLMNGITVDREGGEVNYQ
jgi:hypothetical protein